MKNDGEGNFSQQHPDLENIKESINTPQQGFNSKYKLRKPPAPDPPPSPPAIPARYSEMRTDT